MKFPNVEVSEPIHDRVLGILLYPLLHNLLVEQGKAGVESGSQLVGERLSENSPSRSSPSLSSAQLCCTQ